MTTWTKMKINNLVQIGWANSVLTHVFCKTLFGEMIEPVSKLKVKVQDRQILRPIRKIYQDMLDFAEGKNV
jgi:DNA-directed RNA polymerase delta subunit